jgi:hypothetical protein
MSERFPRFVDTEREDARSNGDLKALVKDFELRLEESREREREIGERFGAAEGEAASRERKLHDKVQFYMEFNQRLEGSRSWRLLQFLRGLFGRKW